jgi:hypothetical protein
MEPDSDGMKTFLCYQDMCNLYGWAMSQSLPQKGFVWLTEEEIADFKIEDVDESLGIGYIIECDLIYPPHLHNLHNFYPMAPSHLQIQKHMLSPFQREFLDSGMHWTSNEKLAPNLLDKENYVVYYKNLKFYIEHGLILSKIHRIIKFEESAWLAPWIELCTEGRKKAKTQFQSDQWKLMANSVYGKSMENKRLHKNFRLIADPGKLSKAVSNPAMRSVKIVNGDLCLVENEKPKICLDKPIYAGFVILEVSKLHMLKYLYEYMIPTYSIRNFSLLYTDTDSFIFSVRTRDLHADMHANSDRFD